MARAEMGGPGLEYSFSKKETEPKPTRAKRPEPQPGDEKWLNSISRVLTPPPAEQTGEHKKDDLD